MSRMFIQPQVPQQRRIVLSVPRTNDRLKGKSRAERRFAGGSWVSIDRGGEISTPRCNCVDTGQHG